MECSFSGNTASQSRLSNLRDIFLGAFDNARLKFFGRSEQ